MEDLARLVEHLHLFLGVAVVGEHVYLRNHVVCQLVGELVHGHALALHYLAVLLLQLSHGLRPRSRCRLIARHMHAAYVGEPVYGFQHHHHHYSGAVGVRDYSARAHKGVFGVAFRHYEGDVVVHTERARVVYHHRAVPGYGFGELARSAGSGRYERIVHPLEVVVVLQEPYLELLAAEGVPASSTPLRAEEQKLVGREIPLFEHAQELLSYRSARTYYCCFHFISSP